MQICNKSRKKGWMFDRSVYRSSLFAHMTVIMPTTRVLVQKMVHHLHTQHITHQREHTPTHILFIQVNVRPFIIHSLTRGH